MRSQHIWTSRDEDGRKREVRVTKFGGNWKFQAKFRDEEKWTYYDVPLARRLCASCATSFSANISVGAPRRRISPRSTKCCAIKPAMDSWDTEQLVADDKRYVWHPFTRWANGARRSMSRSCWWAAKARSCATAAAANTSTAIPRSGRTSTGTIIRGSTRRSARSSIAWRTPPFSAQRIRPPSSWRAKIVELFPQEKFGRVFYSDDGSTGMEAALRIVSQYWRLRGSKRRTFVSFRDAYHGDTAGAASLGAAAMFGAGDGWIPFPVRRVGSVRGVGGDVRIPTKSPPS